MLEKVKLAMGITVSAYDSEIQQLIAAALADLGIAGVDSTLQYDPLILQAVKTYVRAHFRSPADYDRIKAAYDEQKAQLMVATNYTDYSMIGGGCGAAR
jgi:hypothetical protein